MEPYHCALPDNSHDIYIVKEIYDKLVAEFPTCNNAWWVENPKPNIHFEILFHVMEQLVSYSSVWQRRNHNENMYPYFAPFTKSGFNFSEKDLFYIMWQFILRIMDIVNDYNEYFKDDEGNEDWYRKFFHLPFKFDVFNFNYDTTVEQSICDYEDGFRQVDNRNYFNFIPQLIFDNPDQKSTINHLHGCINYFYKDDVNSDINDTTIHDLYKYSSYDVVRKMMRGRGQSNNTSQTNEEYYAGPIITGLRKTDKLNCLPYDFYHGYLYQTILKSNALIITGYSFGDLYVNNLINRMNLIHGEKKRIVLIDKWDQSAINEEICGLKKYLESNVPSNEIIFLEMMSDCGTIGEMIKTFITPDTKTPKYSQNDCVLLFTDGLKDAVENHQDEIVDFLNS